MRFTQVLLVATLVLLSACSDHRPVYSGHQESTEGVPGFKNGKKQSPYVKLGQSYSVDGEEYVPRNQPDYVEEGMASWYGPGFHGGKTANGERFDANELTGAHRTLPLPSIVRVTMVSTGKQVYIRINDRGPFAHSRILDMSRAAADRIGLLRAGVAKVRIEYMPKESQRFTDLLADGRDPKSIDLGSEVIGYSGDSVPVNYARAEARDDEPAASGGSFWDNFSSSRDAAAAEPTPEAAVEALKAPISNETNEAVPVSDVMARDLTAPTASRSGAMAKAAARPNAPLPADDGNSPFAMMDSATQEAEPERIMETASIAPIVKPPATTAATAVASGSYVQLGAFSNQANAERLKNQYQDVANLRIVPKTSASGQTLFHVRAGPFTTSESSSAVRDQFTAAGADAHVIRE